MLQSLRPPLCSFMRRQRTFDSERGRSLADSGESVLNLDELSRGREGGEGEAVDGQL